MANLEAIHRIIRRIMWQKFEIRTKEIRMFNVKNNYPKWHLTVCTFQLLSFSSAEEVILKTLKSYKTFGYFHDYNASRSITAVFLLLYVVTRSVHFLLEIMAPDRSWHGGVNILQAIVELRVVWTFTVNTTIDIQGYGVEVFSTAVPRKLKMRN